MKHFAFLLFFVFFTLGAGATGRSCQFLFGPGRATTDLLSSIETLKGLASPADRERIERFENAIGSGIEVRGTRRDFPRISKVHFLDLKHRLRGERYVVFWPSSVERSPTVEIERTLDLMTQWEFDEVQSKIRLLERPDQFVSRRLDVLSKSLVSKLLIAGSKPETIQTDEKKFLGKPLYVARTFLELSFGLAAKDGANLRATPEVERIFQTYGARGIYRLMLKTYGIKYAARYILRQVALAHVALMAAFAVAVAPTVIQTKMFIDQESTVTIPGATTSEVRSSFTVMSEPARQVLDETQRSTATLSKQDSVEVNDLIHRIRAEAEVKD